MQSRSKGPIWARLIGCNHVLPMGGLNLRIESCPLCRPLSLLRVLQIIFLRCEGVRSSPWIIDQHAWSPFDGNLMTCDLRASISGNMPVTFHNWTKLSDGRTCLAPALKLQLCFRGRALGALGLSPVKRRLWSRSKEKEKCLAQA